LFGSFFVEETLPIFQRYRKVRNEAVRSKDNTGARNELTGKMDMELNTAFHNFIQEHFPKHRLVSEETLSIWPTEGCVWIVDPCDGTHNNMSGSTNYGSACSLIYHGTLAASLIFIPNEEQANGEGFYWAIRGKGAWQRQADGSARRITVSQEQHLKDSFLLFEGPENSIASSPVARHLQTLCWRHRKNSATSISGVLIASGSSYPKGHSALITVNNKAWDNLPARLLVEEGGGIVTDFQGNMPRIMNCGDLVMSNGFVHKEILDAIAEAPSTINPDL
jgi:myo-inositol-1(or 4)-monophosphatase